VRQTGGFLAALERAEQMGAEVVQLWAQNNRQWRPPAPPGPVYDDYRRAVGASAVVSATVCHAPYLINVISPDPPTRERSAAALVANLRAATALGAAGLVLHPGSHRGVEPGSAIRRIAQALVCALDAVEAADGAVCGLWLENTAGAGGTVGRTVSELAEVIDAADADARIGICLDTQHLWASGVRFGTERQANRLVSEVDGRIGLERLGCVHLNDSRVPFGANRDRHENLGLGYIGRAALARVLSHPALRGIPAILEVPGLEGNGPGPADLAVARKLLRG